MPTSSADTAKLMEDLRALMRDADALLKATTHVTGDTIESARDQAATTLDQLKARFSDAQDGLMDEAADALKATGDYVKKNPWASLGIAASIGLIAGLVLSRRNNS